MKIYRALLIVAILCINTKVYSQVFNVSGQVKDNADNSVLIGVPVTIAPAGDTNQKIGIVTDYDGNFMLPNIAVGQYTLTISYIGYEKLQKNISVVDADVTVGQLKLKQSSTTLKTVNITEKQTRAQQLGDTTQFNANAYKTNPDANAEDLVTKMPGITSDANGLKVNGETVKQVYVDGKAFFGDDPNAAMKNLPAEIIDKIQVFDKMSDQSQFTGFDDGNTNKSINIITKRGKNEGQFGKVYAGYGMGQDENTKNRYQVGGSINFFKGDRRISVLGMSNNINQQNFSTEDITGSVGASSGQNRGGGFRGGGRSGGGFQGGGGDFLVGQQGGIANTNSIGINYSDQWGKKIKASGSYFFNSSRNSNISEINRNYFNTGDSTLLYNENDTLVTNNMNHRANLRLEYTIDSNNSITLSPRLSVQNFNSHSTVTGGNSILRALSEDDTNGEQISSIDNYNESKSNGYNFSNNLLYQHKFKKPRRTISLNINTSVNNKDGDGLTAYNSIFYTGLVPETNIDTLMNTNSSKSYSYGANLTYTEPIGKNGQLSVSYNPNFTNNSANKNTDSLNSSTGDIVDAPLLSNRIDNTYTTHRGGLSYRIGDRKLNFNIGLNGQYAILEGTQYEPYAYNINKEFQNLLPNAMLNYRFSQASNVRIFYRTSTNPPSISQLQDVVDISNPLLLKAGNPDLKQDYNHNVSVRFGNTNSKKATNFFVFANGSYVNNYIATETIIPTTDTTYNGIALNRGSQLSRPVNLSGYYSGRAFVTYGMPLEVTKSNLNLNVGYTYSHAPSLLNGQKNFSDNSTINGGLVLGSNINENIDFTLSYNANYNMVKNTLQAQSNNNYFSHVAGAKLNLMFLKGFVFNTSLNHNLYSGLSDATFNQQFLQWNAYLGYKFPKNKALEARISAYDILNQNKSISRNITETYYEDVSTQVLTQYFMLTLTYTLRNFKGGEPKAETEDNNRDRFRPEGMPPGGPGGFR